MRTVEVSRQGRIVHRETHSLEGIDYELTVYAASGGLYGTFQCSACSFTGVSPLMSGTEQDALAHARQNMEAHHGKTHPPARP